MLYVALGETEEIGGSCHLLIAEGTGLMLDAGVHPDKDGPDSLPRLDAIRMRPELFVDHILLTHAHHDHLGALPVVLQREPHALVHMTKATRELAEFLLRASARLQKKRVREGSSTATPLFVEDELEHYEYLYLSHDLEKPFNVTGVRGGSPIEARFWHAGHVLGAAGVELRFTEDGVARRVVYSGDIHLRPQTITPAAEPPEGPVDVLILESTLGADPGAELTTRRTEELRLAQRLADVLDRGGSALIPVFALGRAQEMLALVDRFKKRRLIPAETPVYTAGSLRAITEIYDKTRLTTPRLDRDLIVGDIAQVRLPRSESATLGAMREPSIFIVSSGMMFERTAANELAQWMVDQAKHGIFLVGYAKEDSPGARLLAARPGDEVVIGAATGPQTVQASVERFRFSGHSHRRDLLALVGRLQPKKLVLVHGEAEAKAWMAEQVAQLYPGTEVVLPKAGVAIEI